MGSRTPSTDVSTRDSSALIVTHPTAAERTATWTLSAENWGSTIGLANYLEREEYLIKVPVAENDGVTHWVLVDSSLPPDHRPILASCESLRKPALLRTPDGSVKEVITHGIGSVFCDPKYRGKGYAGRMLTELGPRLEQWQTDATIRGREECKFSILYSDIGKKFYSQMGWHIFPSSHVSFNSRTFSINPTGAKPLFKHQLAELCALDVQRIRTSLQDLRSPKTHVALLPDHDCMQWHHCREDFMTGKLFGRSPSTKGAIAGEDGSRVWAIWTRTYYGPVDQKTDDNTLHLLRLVIENEENTEANAHSLKGIVELAQAEAEEWKCQHVELWNPSSYVKELISLTGLEHQHTDRESESLASLRWYGTGSGQVDEIEWIGNEKYGWC